MDIFEEGLNNQNTEFGQNFKMTMVSLIEKNAFRQNFKNDHRNLFLKNDY